MIQPSFDRLKLQKWVPWKQGFDTTPVAIAVWLNPYCVLRSLLIQCFTCINPGDLKETAQPSGKRPLPVVPKGDFQCPRDGKTRRGNEMVFLWNGSSILLANQLDLGRLGEKRINPPTPHQVSGLGNPNNVGSFAEMVTTGSGRRSLGWTHWVHGALGTLTRGHQASTGARSGAGTQGANRGLRQSQVLAALGWYIKHWSECAGLRGKSEWVTELEAAESSSAPSLLCLYTIVCSTIQPLLNKNGGGGDNLVPGSAL